jgi:RNA polymerase sigma-32 factor
VRIYRKTGESDPQVLASLTGLAVAAAERLLPVLTARETSIEQPGTSGLSPLDRLPWVGPTPEEDAMRHDRTRKLKLELRRFLREISARERIILRARWMSESPATLEQLGARFGISKERVRQLEARTLTQLRGRLLACPGLAEAC